jgi:hypothetical protein
LPRPAVFQPVLDNYSWFTPALYGVIVDGRTMGYLLIFVK